VAPGDGITAKVGRPSKYTVALGVEICRRLAEGEGLRAICTTKGMPSRNAVRRWLAENSDFRTQYAMARDFTVDSLAEEALHWARPRRLRTPTRGASMSTPSSGT